jgi:hypothetical protein
LVADVFSAKRLCLWLEQQRGALNYGWNWDLTDTDDFPAAVHTFGMAYSSDIPLARANVNTIRIPYVLSISSTREYCLRFRCVLASGIRLDDPTDQVPSYIRQRILIDVASSDGDSPEGTTRMTIAGEEYDFQETWSGPSGAPDWVVFHFTKVAPAHGGVVQFHEFLRVLSEGNHLYDPEWEIMTILFYPQIAGGIGELTVEDYRVEVEWK